MALNLSTLTNASTSGDVLAEVLTTADFLEPTPVLRNLARGSQKGGDAKQGTALNQPKALPYDGKGYLYLSGVSGNYASVPDPIGALDDFTIQVDGLDAGSVRPSAIGTPISYFGDANVNRSFILQIGPTGKIVLYLYLNTDLVFTYNESTAVPTNTVGIRVTRVGTVLTYWVDTGSGYVSHDTDIVPTTPLHNPASIVSVNIGQFSGGNRLLGKIGRAVIWNNGTASGTPVLDVDFTATNVRHGDTKFKCATGQVVTINQSGNDPATVIKKSVLRFDGTNDSLHGLFTNNIDSGYMFAAFSVLGDGGEAHSRILSINKTGVGNDFSGTGAVFASREADTNGLRGYYHSVLNLHSGLFDNSVGSILNEAKIKSGESISRVNNADYKSDTRVTLIDSNEFNIGSRNLDVSSNPAIDLEFLALFPATITDDQADSVVNYINNRNNVFSLIDSQGYYFYNAQSAPVGAISSGSASWNGRIVGSDLGDANKYATQATANDQPVSDGYVVTFADNSDHLDIPSTTQAGWQIVGSSIGTFVYRVDSDSISGLHLLGNDADYDDGTTQRKNGQLYGIMLLPLSATSADLNEAKKLLIDRGASEEAQASGSQYYSAWYQRRDIVEFPAHTFPNATTLQIAWHVCNSMTDFGAIQAPLCTNFTSAWKSCSALTSFPSGAKLGTSASNVNFTSAWQSSGLTSFPALDLSKGNNFFNAFQGCSSLTTIDEGILLGTAVTAANVNFNSAFLGSGISSLPSNFDLSKGNIFYKTFMNCSALTSFPAGAQLGNDATDVNFTQAWRSSGLTSFSTPLLKGKVFDQTWRDCLSLADFAADVFTNWNPTSITSGIFDKAWDGCSALTAQSVENILTSIDASGKYATTNGASGGSALVNAGIDIDYNTGTGSLSAATNTAVTSLKAKGWSIIVNNVTL